MAESEIRAGRKKSWFPRSSRNFSLANIEQDIWDWGYQREADQRDAQEAAALASLPDPNVNHAEGSARYRFDPQRDPGGYIRALVEETNAVRRGDPQFGRFGPQLVHRNKTPGQLDNDARQRYFMDQVLAAYGRPEQPNVPPTSWGSLPEDMQMDMMAYAMDKEGYRSTLSDPEEYTGVLGPGSGLGTAMTWSMAFPAMGYGAVGMAQGDDGADERFTRALNTATAPGQFLAAAAGYAPEPQPGHSAWKDQADTRGKWNNAHWTEGLQYAPNESGPRAADLVKDFAQSQESQAGRMEEGAEFFERQGVPKTAARFAGAATDALANPLFNFSGVGSALKSMKALPVATQALYEFGPDMAIATGLTVGEYLAAQQEERQRREQERMDRLIGRLGN